MNRLLKFDDSKALAFQRPSLTSVNEKDLSTMPVYDILCGKSAGLPFEYLMTDIYSGCLPIKSICYGNCSAAEYWINKGYNFGSRHINNFDEASFRKSIEQLSPDQRWLRQGWVSDVSLSKKSWELLGPISDVLMEYNIHMVIITKIFTKPSEEVMRKLAANKTELRVSISAIDTKHEIERRFDGLEAYRQEGGLSVPYLMSFKYADEILRNNQELIVEKIVEDDYIGAEHPLRLSNDNLGLDSAETERHYHPKFADQTWFGRLYEEVGNFILPPPTFLPADYTFDFLRYSDVQKAGAQFKFNNLPTYKDLIEKNLIHNNTFDHASYDVK
ncbi:MAG: hypothetical protein JO154_10965 [Chitinophaga sp.]|uniref:hypothetical protein n=1 Tax=Chitinophaga sp. TaxID=1869181 RepID=UPI0025B9212E|nr:hypothetical protein [Chitinophaga sp.]MBV8253118.1 hypothetical protein [Chitinophaga sp.]